MSNYKLINNVLGWVMFTVALTVYTLTLESSVSLWDCGEFIAASYKLQVVHPPGAPFFLLMGRFFSMLASAADQVAFWVNMMSAVVSALTVMFTFWITTHFARKLISKTGDDSTVNMLAIMGSGLIAALSLTFSDSFWFSAVEAEVYAMSSCFTALTFWAMLKWEDSNSPYADKWIVLIFFMTGLAIGTHLLNLLVIPAVCFIYYFKHYTPTRKGVIYCSLTGLGILFFLLNVVTIRTPKLMAMMDLFFVNSLGLGFNSGVIFTILLIIGGLSYAIYYFRVKSPNPVFSLAFISLAYVLLGYSTYAMVVVRSLDNPPIDMNNPEEPFNLNSYISREQYGDRPLLYGPHFNASPADENGDGMADVKTGNSVYRKDSTEYTFIMDRQEYIWDKEYCTVFPRMGDMSKDNGEAGYRFWGGMNDIQNEILRIEQNMSQAKDENQKQQMTDRLRELKAEKPTMANNLSFLFRYQIGHMYWRYFMWNFAGRQNDGQGHSWNRKLEGNWISGISFLDGMRLGPQKNIPDYLVNNKARNKYYLIPLILGILGAIYHFRKGKKDAIVTSILFLFTGLLIVVYLNQPPFEPRERDYSLVGSFQTFCIWMGLGVFYLWDKLKNRINSKAAVAIAILAAGTAPYLMAKDGWDDHDRSERRLGIDFAINYLHSCPKNAILFTNGDNDTYPLWYAQNVEGIRKDVRIINQSLLPTDWYSQVLLTKVYDSEPLPLTLNRSDLATGNNDYFYSPGERAVKQMNLREAIERIKSGRSGEYYPARNYVVPVNRDAVLQSGILKNSDTANVANEMVINFPNRSMTKGDLVLLDLIATNAESGWKRPICFTTTSGSEGFLNMEPYFERLGLVYRLIPVKSENSRNNVTKADEEVMYDNLMNNFKYSGISQKKNFYLDDKAAIVPNTIQQLFISQAGEYINAMYRIKMTDSALVMPGNAELVAGNKEKAVKLLNKSLEVLPLNILNTRDNDLLNMAKIYHECDQNEKAGELLERLFKICKQEAVFFTQFSGSKYNSLYYGQLLNGSKSYLENTIKLANQWELKTLADKFKAESKDLLPAIDAYLEKTSELD